MSSSRTKNHQDAALSGFLAAAICMAITQVLGLALHLGAVSGVLLVGLSLSSIAFGGTYAGVFFASLAGSRRRRSHDVPATR
jgi:hypothetical protein